jgi:hypothetical protein
LPLHRKSAGRTLNNYFRWLMTIIWCTSPEQRIFIHEADPIQIASVSFSIVS